MLSFCRQRAITGINFCPYWYRPMASPGNNAPMHDTHTHQWPCNGPLTRYVKLRLREAHAPGMPGTFFPPPNLKETVSYRSRYASRHVRDARAVMHVGFANPRRRAKRSRHSRRMCNLAIWQEARFVNHSFIKYTSQPCFCRAVGNLLLFHNTETER